MSVNFYENVDDGLLKFAVIMTKTNGKWVFCKHKLRDTWEVPGGHREPNENIIDTAKRELIEETGAIDFKLKPICAYSVLMMTVQREQKHSVCYAMPMCILSAKSTARLKKLSLPMKCLQIGLTRLSSRSSLKKFKSI